MTIEDVRRRVYPEVLAGGFADNDGSLLFYSRVNALVDSDSVVLDFGAGRGVAQQTDPCDYRRGLRALRGRVKKVVGCDVDPVVSTHPGLDEAHVIDSSGRLPFEDQAFDLIVSDFVFEHVADPEPVAAELERVLEPGGWIVARTPNAYGYAAIATRLIPSPLRPAVLRLTNPDAGGRDNFPVVLRMNTRRRLARLFPRDRFDDFSYVRRFEGMGYFGRSALLLRAARLLLHFVPKAMGPEIIVALRKRGASPRNTFVKPSIDLEELPALLTARRPLDPMMKQSCGPRSRDRQREGGKRRG